MSDDMRQLVTVKVTRREFLKLPMNIRRRALRIHADEFILNQAAPDLLAACIAAKKYLEPDLVEPGRTVFWKLVDALKKARGK